MPPVFDADVLEIPASVRAEMIGRSWHDVPDCLPFSALRLLELPYVGLDGLVHRGELVVAAEIAVEVVAIFERLFDARFPIARMERVDAFDGDDDRSMAANNTSAFNHRRIAGGTKLSHHALGVAIDINPRWNPMILGGVVHPPEAVDSVDRTVRVPGWIGRPGVVVETFESFGWEWGGDWPDLLDYHHFSRIRRDDLPGVTAGSR